MNAGFKTNAFGGFKKKEVVDYLDRLGKEREAELSRGGAKVRELEQKVEELSLERDALKRKLAEKEEELSCLLEGYEGLSGELEAIRGGNEEIRARLGSGALAPGDDTPLGEDGGFVDALVLLKEIGDRLGYVADKLTALVDPASPKGSGGDGPKTVKLSPLQQEPKGAKPADENKRISSVKSLLEHIKVNKS